LHGVDLSIVRGCRHDHPIFCCRKSPAVLGRDGSGGQLFGRRWRPRRREPLDDGGPETADTRADGGDDLGQDGDPGDGGGDGGPGSVPGDSPFETRASLLGRLVSSAGDA
jgi:hypothetical protein